MHASDLDYYLEQGLPNLGNTCYLNSAIQYLYSSEKFKEKLVQSSQRDSKSNLTYHILNVFHQIVINGSRKSKEMCMRKLMDKLESLDKKIKCNKQQDLFQILMIILNQLFQENQNLQDLFMMQTKNKCQCGFFYSSNLFLTNQRQICFKCNTTIEIQIIKESHLLIISNHQQNSKENTNNTFFKEFNNKIFYSCIAKVYYSGNSQVGHYRASRICGQHFFILFNDSSGFIEYEQAKQPIYLLYEKLQQKQQKKVLKCKKGEKIQEKPLSKIKLEPLNDSNRITLNKKYRSEVNLIYKVTASKTLRSSRNVYFQFKHIKQQHRFQMNILNKKQFFCEIQNISKCLNKDIKAEQLIISTFLNEFQNQMNDKIQRFYRQTKDSELKANFSTSNYIQSSKQNDQFKDLPFTEVIRPKNKFLLRNKQ